MSRRRRQLSEEDEALWDGFVRSIRPLRRSQKTPAREKTPVPAAAKTPRPQRPASPPPAPPLAPLERRLKQRVASGRAPIDARIDLHGLTQNEAYAALLRFLEQAHADGGRIALVVTGKGGKGGGGGSHDRAGERGVLRRQVPIWLELPAFRALVVGFDNAHAGHGGDGALYVRLRRRR
jgi:DNA-nicking Smr family endonuclease